MKQLIVLVITVCFFSLGKTSELFAQAVWGYVRDAATGEPLPFATVLLPQRSTGFSANRFGFFSMKIIPQDTLLLRFSYVGYHPFDTIVVARGQLQISLEILLKQKVLPLEEIEILGKHSFYDDRSFPSTSVLHQKQLDAFPAIGEQDLLRSLQYFPGITFNSEASSSTYIRGGTPDQTLILLDGMPVYNPSHAFGFFSMFHLDALKAVKVLKGGFPAEYGTRTGSVIDILSADGNRKAFGGKGSLGLITSGIFLNGPIGVGSWMFAARRSYFDLLTGLAPSSATIPKYYFYDIHARVSQDVGNQEQLKATVLINQDKLSYNRPSGGVQDSPVFEWSNKLMGAEWTKVLSSSAFVRVQGSLSRYGGHLDLPADLLLESVHGFDQQAVTYANALDDYTLKAELESLLDGEQLLTAGLFYSYYRLSASATRPFTLERQHIQTRYGLFGIFVQNQLPLHDKFSALPGFRITMLPHEANLFFEPRVILSYQLTPTLQTKIGTGLYYQWLNGAQPASMYTFSGIDFWYPVEKSTSASRAIQLSGDLDWYPDPEYSITFSAYTNWLTNVVELKQNFEESPDLAGMFSTGKGWNSGVELFVERSGGPIRGAIGYTLSWALRKFDDIEKGRIFPARHDKRHMINIVAIAYPSETWSVSAAWTFSTGPAYTGIVGRYSFRPLGFEKLVPPFGYSLSLLSKRNALRLPEYHRLDVSIGKTFVYNHWKLGLRLDVFNVYNRKNALGANPDFSLDADPYYRLLPVIPTLTIEAEF